MNCVFCQNKNSRAINTRIIKNKGIIKRRRECLDCGKRFTTYEQISKKT